MKPELHSLLSRQLKKLGLGEYSLPTVDQWQALLKRVSETYTEEDRSRYLLERSLVLSSSEMQHLNQALTASLEKLADEKEKLERSHLELAQITSYDPLSGLPNRNHFRNHLQSLLTTSNPDALCALLIIDLDGFKDINDTFGHALGDQLIQLAGHRLCSRVRKTDFVARLGGDEFAIVLHDLPSIEKTTQVTEQIIKSFEDRFDLEGHQLSITCSIGIALFPDDTQHLEGLIQAAETAMYKAKSFGKNQYWLFGREANAGTLERMALLQNMGKGLENREFFLLYQPRVNLQSERLVSVEALVRWKNAERGIVSPATFIPLAEESGLIHPLGDFVLHEAAQQAKYWSDLGHPLRVAVNISVKQLQREDFVDKVRKVLEQTKLEPGLLELEITESTAMTNVEHNIVKLAQLRAMGVYLSIDDFGTAYSSLNYLRKLPVNSLKIDQSFVRDLELESPQERGVGRAIVRSIIALGQNLELCLIAEGVETQAQLAFLRETACTEAQGYYFFKPIGPDDITRQLQGVLEAVAN